MGEKAFWPTFKKKYCSHEEARYHRSESKVYYNGLIIISRGINLYIPGIDFRRQYLTSKVGPHNVRVNIHNACRPITGIQIKLKELSRTFMPISN